MESGACTVPGSNPHCAQRSELCSLIKFARKPLGPCTWPSTVKNRNLRKSKIVDEVLDICPIEWCSMWQDICSNRRLTRSNTPARQLPDPSAPNSDPPRQLFNVVYRCQVDEKNSVGHWATSLAHLSGPHDQSNYCTEHPSVV